MAVSRCDGCGVVLVSTGRGRPRKWCDGCVSKSDSRHRAYSVTYRREHPLVRPAKPCRRCGLVPAVSARHWYCVECRRWLDAEAKRLGWGGPEKRKARRQVSASRRGYGSEHQNLRRVWAPRVAGGRVACATCGQLIVPGTPWDLGHREDRSGYVGPEHAGCNRRKGGYKGLAGLRSRPRRRVA